MNIGNIVTPNTKGQIVIPQKMRGGLGITSDTPLHLSLTGDAIMIRPIRSIITNNDTHFARADVLKIQRARGRVMIGQKQKKKEIR